eukprot:876404-Amphidinium_carterae.1
MTMFPLCQFESPDCVYGRRKLNPAVTEVRLLLRLCKTYSRTDSANNPNLRMYGVRLKPELPSSDE